MGYWVPAFVAEGKEVLLFPPPLPGKSQLYFQARDVATGKIVRQSANFDQLDPITYRLRR